MPEPGTPPRPTLLDVDLEAIVHNAGALSRHAGRPLLAVVKANAYGMGAVPVARALADCPDVAWLGVALAEEGIQLRRAGIGHPILLLGPASPRQVNLLLDGGLTPAIYSRPFLEALEGAAASRGTTVEAHLKVDSGMGRLGFRPEELPAVLALLSQCTHVRITGLFSNLASADDLGSGQTDAQLTTLLAIQDLLHGAGISPQWVHLANSSGLLAHPPTRLTLCRPGLTLYGLKPSQSLPEAGLRTTVEFHTEVAQVKHLPPGTPVGYGATFRTDGDLTLGILPIGYADGLPRCLQGVGHVLVRGARCPIVGRVSMDLTAVDLTAVDLTVAGPVEAGAAVTLWGRDGDESLGPWDWARWSGTIPYEVMTGLGCRVTRRYAFEGRTWLEPVLGL